MPATPIEQTPDDKGTTFSTSAFILYIVCYLEAVLEEAIWPTPGPGDCVQNSLSALRVVVSPTPREFFSQCQQYRVILTIISFIRVDYKTALPCFLELITVRAVPPQVVYLFVYINF